MPQPKRPCGTSRRGLADGATPTELLPETASAYREAALWIEAMSEAEPINDHVDEFFVDSVLMGLARELRLTLLALTAAQAQNADLEPERLTELHLRLVRIFAARLSNFERKRYANLSQEANKAMNLNSYISLMGTRWVPDQRGDATVLRPVDTVRFRRRSPGPGHPGLRVPADP